MGEPTAASDLQGHLNAAIRDICNSYPFSWNRTTANLTLSSGTADLPADFNPVWGVYDARIVATGQENDHVFTQIDIKEKDLHSSDDYVFWITYNTADEVYVFNTPTQTGTVTILYQFTPADLSSDDTAMCIVPDIEAVAYLGASKMWIGDERNQSLKNDFSQESSARVRAMYAHDMAFSAAPTQGSVIDYNSELQ